MGFSKAHRYHPELNCTELAFCVFGPWNYVTVLKESCRCPFGVTLSHGITLLSFRNHVTVPSVLHYCPSGDVRSDPPVAFHSSKPRTAKTGQRNFTRRGCGYVTTHWHQQKHHGYIKMSRASQLCGDYLRLRQPPCITASAPQNWR